MRIIILFIILLLATPAAAAESMRSLNPADNEKIGIAVKPGYYFIFPDGSRGWIKEELENGNFVTDTGLIISPEGVLLNGPDEGSLIIMTKEKSAQVSGNGNIAVEEETVLAHTNQDKTGSPESMPENGKVKKQPDGADATAQTPTEDPSHVITIADLLPSTPNPEETPAASETKTVQKENKKEDKNKKEEKKDTPAKTEKTGKQESGVKNTEPKKKPREPVAKTAPGKELRISEQAIKTGNLDFLEGCWQGTRPEYYSKRTIRECFCFGKNGKNGKRRVFDPTYRRKCIGSSNASLSGSGVLFVTSSGAACSDGERWGQAEMTCRNSGPRTPCSWIFRDAQNGRQSYQIPFVRVNSCGN